MAGTTAALEVLGAEAAGVEALSVRNVWKTYPGGVVANRDVSLEVRRGEVVALLGENGAGKTTLVSIIAGLVRPDKGEIRVYGERLVPGSVRDAVAKGVALVPQHPKLIDSYTVEENIGLYLWSMGLPVPRDLGAYLETLMEENRFRVPFDRKVYSLSFGEKQKAELLKALASKPRVLLVDEATTHLSPREFEDFALLFRRLARRGVSVLFITHKLREALSVANRIAVMRHGRLVAVVDAQRTSREQLLRYMFGEDYSPRRVAGGSGAASERSPVVLRVEGLYVRDDYGRMTVRNASLVLRRGEVVGVAGVAGNGQRELFEAILGLRRPVKGRITVLGLDVTRKGAWARARLGVGVVPEERLGWGLVPGKSILFNTAFPLAAGNGGVWVDWAKWRRVAERVVEEYGVKARSVDTRVDELSGGNMQKLVLGRELGAKQPSLVLAMNPTSGLDARTAETVLALIASVARRGTGVLLFSEDLDELVEVSTRILVMSRGRIVGEYTPPYSVAEIGEAMTS